MPKPKVNRSGIYSVAICYRYKRCTITLGKIEKTEADYFCNQLNYLISHQQHNSGPLPVALSSWVESLTQHHRQQFSDIELLSKFDASLTVQQLVDMFTKAYELRPSSEVRDSTKRQFKAALKHRIQPRLKAMKLAELEPVKEHHRPNAKPVFTEVALAAFRSCESWQREHFAKSTWSRANGRLKEVGKWAVENGACDYNPFSPLPSPGEVNEDRNFNVPREWIEDAMEMCIDPDTRLILVLGRFAGFRIPSEARTLKWSHVDWGKSQMQVFDSKKHKFRTMPLFGRIRRELERHKKACTPTSKFVMSERFRSTADSNNYNLIKEAIARTEHDLWPRLRQNLRSSCENDLLNAGFDERLVTQWLGHTVKVSRAHYQKLTDADYRAAVEQFE